MLKLFLILAIGQFWTPIFGQKKIGHQKKPDVLAAFKMVVSKVNDRFGGSPIFLVSKYYPASASSVLYYRLKFEEVDIGYNVEKTNSLVSPYIGYIVLTLNVKSNQESGNVGTYQAGTVGFSDSASAKASDVFISCGPRQTNKSCIGEIKVNYAYQNGEWVFKMVETETGQRIEVDTIRADIEGGIVNRLFLPG